MIFFCSFKDERKRQSAVSFGARTTIEFTSRPFGLTLCSNGKAKNAYVTGIKSELKTREPRLNLGSRIISLNGKCVLHFSHSRIIFLLHNMKMPLRIEFEEGESTVIFFFSVLFFCLSRLIF